MTSAKEDTEQPPDEGDYYHNPQEVDDPAYDVDYNHEDELDQKDKEGNP